MTLGRRRVEHFLLPLALGVSDGILNALTLASASVVEGSGLRISVIARVAVAALVTAVFTVFVAEYAQYRSDLARAEHELNFTRSGRLAATSLGRAVFLDALLAAVIAGSASFVGAFAPLLIGGIFVRFPWVSIVVSVLALGALGAVLANVVHGSRAIWASALAIAGIAVTFIGIQLHLV